MKITDVVYPECTIRPERFASQFEAVDCANKTARLGAAILVAVTMVAIMAYIYFSGQVGVGVWIVTIGVLLLAGFQVFTSGLIAERNWRANDTKITSVMQMTPGMTRAQAAEIVVRENMAQEANEIAAEAARAQSRMNTNLSINTGMNMLNFVRSNK